MDNVNKTLYIPLYGKAYVSKKGIILKDKKAEKIWDQAGFMLSGKAASKYLAYYMGMRSRVYDELVKREMFKGTIVIHIGCGLDSRCERIGQGIEWYDLDFEEVIQERKKYYQETENYHMIPTDLRNMEWLTKMPKNKKAIVVMEGVSMYLKEEELLSIFKAINDYFPALSLYMDVYSEFAAKASKYKNPINEVGVTEVYGYDNPRFLEKAGLHYIQEYEMTPYELIEQLDFKEKILFKTIYSGKTAQKLYHLYAYRGRR